MAKKRAKRNTSSRSVRADIDIGRLNAILVENFVKLQKAMTNLASNYDNLSDQISKLLQLFEISARSFAEKLSTGTGTDIEKDREFLDKLNKLLDQNKVIAKGLTLMEEKMKERLYGSPNTQQAVPRPAPNYSPPPAPAGPPGMEGYSPSSFTPKERKTREL